MTHRGRTIRPLATPHAVVACAIVAAAFSVGCADIGLNPIDDPYTRGGSTLPVPDMTGVSFSQEGLSGPMVVSGETGAMWADGEVIATNQSTGTADRSFATARGSFVIPLSDANVGHTITLATGTGGAAAPDDWAHTTDSTVPVTLELTPGGDEPPAPVDLIANALDTPPGAVVVNGLFAIADMPVEVRVLHPVTGAVFTGPTFLDLSHHTFELQVEADVGDELWVHGVRTDLDNTPGPFTRTTVLP